VAGRLPNAIDHLPAPPRHAVRRPLADPVTVGTPTVAGHAHP